MRGLPLLAFAIVAAAATACGGGGGSSTVPTASNPPASGQGQLVIRIPTNLQSVARKPAYVSASTHSVSFQVSPNPVQVVPLNLGSAACPLSAGFYACSAFFNAPTGTNTMIVKTFASSDGTGTPLSMNAIPITIVAGQTNSVNAILNGVVAKLTLALSPSSVTSGTKSSVQALWGGLDASNNNIVGPGSLVDANGNPIVPSLSSSNTAHFSIAPLQSPTPGWTIAYDGAAVSSPTITLSASGFTSAAEILAVTPPATATPGPTPHGLTDWASFGYDLERTGYNPNETTIGSSNVGTVVTLWPNSVNVGSSMVKEPVLASNVTINGKLTNVLYAGSNFGSALYAINADTGAVIWKFPVPSAPYTCTSASQFSIAGTPAIDRVKSRIYFADGQNNVHALDLATGTEASGWPIFIASYAGEHNFMHGGFAFNPANGMLYVVTGSTCDISPWHGRIDAINTSSATIVGQFFPVSASSIQGDSGGGVWGPGGPAIDPATNDVFIATGNSDTQVVSSQTEGYSEQIVELSPTLGSVLAHNYPANIPSVTGGLDFDFGATPLLFQPNGCPALLAAVNKSGMFELYDRGSIGSGPVDAIQMATSTDNGNFVGTPAWDPVTQFVYVGLPATFGNYHPGMAAFRMQSNCTLDPTPVWSAAFGPDGATVTTQTPRSPITIANGVVYVSNYSGQTQFAFNAATGAQLWSVGLNGFGVSGAVVANGRIYISSSSGTITAYALP